MDDVPSGLVTGWQIATGALILSALVSVAGTWVVSALLLRAYRNRVRLGMRSGSADFDRAWPAPPPPGSPQRVAVVPVSRATPTPVLVESRRRSRLAQVLVASAAAVYGLSSAVIFYTLEDFPLDGRAVAGVVAIALIYAWPVVPSLLAQLPTGRASLTVMLWIVYLAVPVALMMMAGSGTSFTLAMIQVVWLILLPALFVLATSARLVRGVSWLVAPGLLLISLAVVQLQWPVRYLALGLFDRHAAAFLLGGLACLVALALYCLALLRAYQAKIIGDQTLLLLQWWMAATLINVLDMAASHGLSGAWDFLPMILLGITLAVGWRLTRGTETPPRRLLVLRTFGARRRSTRLMRDLNRQWRWVGSVELITAPDVASETLDPDEFVDFLRGQLSDRFVDSQAALDRRLLDLDLRRDADGRFRVNEFLCHTDQWKAAVEALITTADAVLIDLRGLTPQRAGVAYELERLVNLIDLRRVVAVIDETTDPGTLQWTLDRAAAFATEDAPIKRSGVAEMHVVHIAHGPLQSSRPMLGAVFSAAADGPGQPAPELGTATG